MARRCTGPAGVWAGQLDASPGRLHPDAGGVQLGPVPLQVDRRRVLRRVPGHRLSPPAAAAAVRQR